MDGPRADRAVPVPVTGTVQYRSVLTDLTAQQWWVRSFNLNVGSTYFCSSNMPEVFVKHGQQEAIKGSVACRWRLS